MRDLSDIRREIDAIDDAIIDLLARRFALLPEVVAYKESHGLPPTIPERVDEVLNRNAARAAEKNVSPELARALWQQIISAMCRAEAEVMHS